MWLARIIASGRLGRFLSLILLAGLVLLFDGWLLVRLSRDIGVYAALAIEASTALVAVVVVGGSINRISRHLRRSARLGDPQPRRLADVVVLFVAACLLAAPGFATDAVGMVLYMYPGRRAAAWVTGRLSRAFLATAWEHITLEVSAATGATRQGDE